MDVLGLMDQVIKDMVKCFYILLYLFFSWIYKNVDVVYICYYIQVKEVDEYEFFYFQEIGGIIVFSVLKLMDEVVQVCYDLVQWNIYVVQVLDGDNWVDDFLLCYELLVKKILLVVCYYSYIEIICWVYQILWCEYEYLQVIFDNFVMQYICDQEDIYLVFCELFYKQLFKSEV